MWKVSWRSLTSHPLRLLATAASIVLGVGFFVGTGVLTSTARSSIDAVVADAFDGVDLAVRSSEGMDTGNVVLRPKIPSGLSERIAATDGVAEVHPNRTGYAQVIGTDGKVLDGVSIGYGWSDSELNPFRLVEGRAPVGPDEIVVDRASLADGDLELGQQVRVLPAPESAVFRIVGSVSYGEADSLLNQRVVMLSADGADVLFGTDQVDQILVGVESGAGVDAVRSRLSDVLGDELEVVSGATITRESQDLVDGITSLIDTALQTFALIALGVGVFIIYNTFSVIVAQRTREMALLRAIGATGRQVRTSVLVESAVLGAAASAVGVVVGIGIGWALLRLIARFGIDLGSRPSVPAATIAVAIAAGIVITMASASLPARRAARVPPLAAMRRMATDPERISTARIVGGLGIAALGALEVARALGPGSAWELAVAAVAFIGAVMVLGPVIDPPIARRLGGAMARVGGFSAQLAGDNAARNARRTATTAGALLIGVMLVSAATVFATSVSASVRGELERQLLAELVVGVNPTSRQVGGGLGAELVDAIQEAPAVAVGSATREANGAVDGNYALVIGVDPETIDDVVDLNVIAGALSNLDERSVSLGQETAADLDVGLGDSVTIVLPEGPVTLTVAAIHEQDSVLSNWLVATPVIEANTTGSLTGFVFVNAADGDTAAAQAAISDLIADDPIATVDTAGQFIDGQTSQIDVLLYVIYALLGVSVLIAVIGIINTMALAVMERTREIGLLRAVGMTRGQVRATVRWEAGFVAVIGTGLGLGLGLLLGWLASEAVSDTFETFSVPFVSLAVIAVAGAVCGVAAGVLPARRAARLDVLDAIATE